jgi:probable selenium-dependent hydroxylase accessory protein YqeC
MTYLFALPNTHFAIRAEQILLERIENVFVMPLPSVIKSGCGICLRVQKEDVDVSMDILNKNQIPYTLYYILEEEGKKQYKPVLGGILCSHFSIKKKEMISITGCRGKTTLLYKLGEELKMFPVLLSTTTKMFPPEMGQVDYKYVEGGQCIRITPPLSAGRYYISEYDEELKKCTAISPQSLKELSLNFYATIIEADGSRGLPIKGYDVNEPCTPRDTTLTIGVVSIKSIGSKVEEDIVLHIDEFCNMIGIKRGEIITPRHIGQWIAHNKGMFKDSNTRKILFFNQIESVEEEKIVQEIIQEIPKDFQLDGILSGSLKNGKYQQIV